MQTYNDDFLEKDVERPNEPHLACVLLLDTSFSMKGEKIDALNNGLRDLKKFLEMEYYTRSGLDMAIVEFNNEIRVVQDFKPLHLMDTIPLEAKGGNGALMGQGIETALELVKQRNNMYARIGVPSYRPWVLMISNSVPSDDITVAREHLLEKENKRKLRFVAAGLDGCDWESLESLTNLTVEIVDPAAFTNFFHWSFEAILCRSFRLAGCIYPPSLPEPNPNSGVKFHHTIPSDW